MVCAMLDNAKRAETKASNAIQANLDGIPIWDEFLSQVPGCGPRIAGNLIASIDISKARYASSLWKLCGYDVAQDGRGRSRRKEHLVDKVTILSIKLQKIKSEDKLVNVRKEYQILRDSMEAVGIKTDSKEFKDLLSVNLNLWDIEDRIRLKEANRQFDEEFIELARSVYIQNDRRFELKRSINLTYESELIEEKEYVDYKKG